MPDTLDTEQIRRLIFKAKLQKGTVFDFARTLGDMAFNEGLIQQRPDFASLTNWSAKIGENILEVIWGLIIEGVYAPGSSIQNPSFPGIRATEYGRICLEKGELTAHDQDDYLKRLKAAWPNIDATTLLYVEEALGSFRAGRFLAAAVMIGVASER